MKVRLDNEMMCNGIDIFVYLFQAAKPRIICPTDKGKARSNEMVWDGIYNLLIIPGGQAKNNCPTDEGETRWMMI
jgi:hypothetical protein